MSREDDRWRLPALERFGEQLRGAENAEQHTGEDRPSRWRGFGARAAVLIVTLALIAAVLNVVTPAGALSPINHAPVAAEKSRSVRFSSGVEVSLNGRRLTRFSEHGVLDFVTGEYDTTLNLSAERIERRRVGNVYFGAEWQAGVRPRRSRWHAIRVPQVGSKFRPAPGGYALVDPQVALRVLGESRSPVRVIGHERLAGVGTTHYRLSTNLAAFLAAARSSLADIPSYKRVRTELDVWLDRQGRPTRVEATSLGRSRFGNATITTRVDFTDYGVPVIVRPPANAMFSTRNGTGPLSPLGGDPLRTVERLLFGQL